MSFKIEITNEETGEIVYKRENVGNIVAQMLLAQTKQLDKLIGYKPPTDLPGVTPPK